MLHKFSDIVKHGGSQIGCSRSESDHKIPSKINADRGSRQYKSGPLKIGYKWCIKFVFTKKYKDHKKKRRECWKDETPIVVKTMCFEHTDGCGPSCQQLLLTKERAGNFISNFNNHALQDVCLSIKRHGHIKS